MSPSRDEVVPPEFGDCSCAAESGGGPLGGVGNESFMLSGARARARAGGMGRASTESGTRGDKEVPLVRGTVGDF